MATLMIDGLQSLAIRAGSSTCGVFLYGALSSNAGAESSTHTTLTGELATAGLCRATMTFTNPTTYVAQWSYTWTSTQTVDIMKFALFNTNTSGNMLVEHLFSGAKGLVSGETLTITAQMTVAAA